VIVWALLIISLIGLTSSTVFLFLVIRGARRFKSRPLPPSSGPLPFVTVLKPLRGLEPFLERNLESFFQQEYPRFELIFGVRHNSDPALEVVRKLQRQYPNVKTQFIVSGDPLYPNAKVFAMEPMVAAAAGSYLVITDSDVCVDRHCVMEVVKPLLNPNVGVVTCLYRGVPAGGFWSRLEALGMSVEMSSGVLVADMLEGMRFALGPTMATRLDVLELLGGMRALADYCADDYVLGRNAHAAGKEVVLSHHVIDHVAVGTSARESFLHQVRWMRSTRFSRPSGHAGTGLTYAMPFGVLGLFAGIAAHHWFAGIALLAWAYANRVLQCFVVGRGVVRDPNVPASAWFYPIRDLLGFFVWCASYCGDSILWRGERYRLHHGGKMSRVRKPSFGNSFL